MVHTLVQHDAGETGYLAVPPPRPGIYLDGGTGCMLDVGGDNTAVSTDGRIMLLNNQARIYGRGNGAIEWISVKTNTTTSWPTDTGTGIACGYGPTSATATVKVRYNSLDDNTCDWGPMGYFVGDPDTLSTEWEWHCNGTATKVVVYRGAYDVQSGWIMPSQQELLADRMKKIIHERCAPNFIRDRRALDFAPDIREIRARQTLRRVVGDDRFRDFLKKGFVSVRAKSGKVYQIFPGHGVTNVYFCGKMLERLCVVLSGNFPPTDSLIMRYLLILNNEDQFRSLANVSGPSIPYKALPREPDKRSLVEIFAAFKGQRKAA